MNIKHEKSPCCREKIWRLGGRRRQCSKCNKTWRVWKRKRGRDKKRISVDVVHKFIFNRLLPTRLKLIDRNRRQYRLSKSRQLCFSSCPWKPMSRRGKLIVIADALVKFVEKKWHTWYFILVRPINSDKAIVLPPQHFQGTETVEGWKKTFRAINSDIFSRIRVLVCDGHIGLISEYLRQPKWKLQRCHFHLIARIQGRRSKWKLSRHYEEGWKIYNLTKKVLEEPSKQKILPFIEELKKISEISSSPEIRKTLSGFIKHFQQYRTYLKYPRLKLPITNNSAESFIGLVEDVCRRIRGLKNLKVLNEWIICISKTRAEIKCNGKNTPN